jgi:hypothetical protein
VAAGKRTYSVPTFSVATNRISEGFSLVFAEDGDFTDVAGNDQSPKPSLSICRCNVCHDGEPVFGFSIPNHGNADEGSG